MGRLIFDPTVSGVEREHNPDVIKSAEWVIDLGPDECVFLDFFIAQESAIKKYREV